MSKKNTVAETDVVEEPLVRRGEAVPVDSSTGAPAIDAPAAVQVVGVESTSHNLAKVPGSGESREPSHIGAHRIGES